MSKKAICLVPLITRATFSTSRARGLPEFHVDRQGCGGIALCCDFEIIGTPAERGEGFQTTNVASPTSAIDGAIDPLVPPRAHAHTRAKSHSTHLLAHDSGRR
jgi:hypothetical protein